MPEMETVQQVKSDIKHAGDIIVYETSILPSTSVDGQAIDISALVREINIYESIFENTMSGDITLADGQDLINTIPLIGRELVKIVFGFSNDVEPKSQTFMVYKISPRLIDSSGQIQTYKLHLCSPQLMINRAKKIQKTYEGFHADIVRSIYTDYLEIGEVKKPLFTEYTDKYDKVIIPNWNPLRAINWVSGRAQRRSNPNDCSFLFWEGFDSFKFAPLTYLFEREPRWVYARFNANFADPYTKEKNAGIPFFTIEDLTINESYNRMEQLKNGAYASKTQTYDPLKRSFRINTYNYSNDFSRTIHLNDHPMLPKQNEDLSLQQEAHIQYYPVQEARNGQIQDDFVSEVVPYRNAQLSQLTFMTMNVTTPGSYILQAGDTVNVLFKKQKPAKDNEKEYDEYINGRWLVGSIRHRIVSNSDYGMYITLYKDSVQQPFPDQTSSSS